MESAWSKILTLLYSSLVFAEFCLFLELPKKAMKKGDWNLMAMVVDVMKANIDEENQYLKSVVLRLFEQAKNFSTLKEAPEGQTVQLWEVGRV